MKNQTRESWLESAILHLQNKVFKQHLIPPVRVSIGFPGGRDPKKAIGQAWHPKTSKDGLSQIFISPTHDCSLEVLATLTHELVHALVPDAGHGPQFRKIAKFAGLEGPMRSTVAGPDLTKILTSITAAIGEIPHAHITLAQLSARKKQTTRMIKLICGECGYIARTSTSWLESSGALFCPCNMRDMRNMHRMVRAD